MWRGIKLVQLRNSNTGRTLIQSFQHQGDYYVKLAPSGIDVKEDFIKLQIHWKQRHDKLT